MSAKYQIAIIEDDSELARLTRMMLEDEGYLVSLCYRGDEAVQHIQTNHPDLILLDIMLPGKNGIEVCTEVRKFYSGPIVMLTGRDDDITEVSSFNQGADDYVVKPVRPHVLMARISSLLKRFDKKAEIENEVLVFGSLRLYIKQREVDVDGKSLELVDSEFDLLSLLAKNQDKIVNRETCCEALRGFSYDGMDRSIDMRISTLRKKIGDNNTPHKWIKTVRGKGYMLVSGR